MAVATLTKVEAIIEQVYAYRTLSMEHGADILDAEKTRELTLHESKLISDLRKLDR